MWEQFSEPGLPQRDATFIRNSYWLAQGGLTIILSLSPFRTENDARCTMHDDSAFVNATSGLLIRNALSRRDPQPIIDSLYIRSAEDLCRYNSSRSQTAPSGLSSQ